MRILYLHQYFNTPEMAGGTRSYEMARRLVEKGHDVHMVTSRRDGTGRRSGWKVTDESGINVHWYPVAYSNAMGIRRRLLAFLQFSLSASLRATRIPADVVFATSTPLTIAIPGVRAAKKQRVPMVFEVRDLWPAGPIEMGLLRNPLMRWAALALERYAYRSSKRIVALAPGMKDGIAKADYPTEHITVIPNGCDLDLFAVPEEAGERLRQETPWLGDKPLVVYAGELGPVHDVRYLVRLAAEVRRRDTDVRFAVIGDGKEAAVIRALADELGVLDRSFFMLGQLPKREIPAWLSAADVATSLIMDREFFWKDAVTNKFFDALAAGRPIANNHGGWQTEICLEAGAGLQLHASNFSMAAGQLLNALHDRDWLTSARLAARQIATERFSRDVLAQQLEDVLLSALNTRAR